MVNRTSRSWILYVLMLMMIALTSVSAGTTETPGAGGPILNKLGRVAVMVNDQASLLETRLEDTLSTSTHDMPVVFENTVSTIWTPYASVTWKDLRADKNPSERLAKDCVEYKLGKIFKNKISGALAAASVRVVPDESIQAAINRAQIAHPVKFSDNANRGALPISFESVIKNSSKQYHEWEKSLLADLKKGDLADSLIVINVYLWGAGPGVRRVQGDSDTVKSDRFANTGNILDAYFASNNAQTMFMTQVRMLDAKTGDLLLQKDMNYSISGKDLTLEQLMANNSSLFIHYTTCLVDWYSENLKRDLMGSPPLEGWQCHDYIKP